MMKIISQIGSFISALTGKEKMLALGSAAIDQVVTLETVAAFISGVGTVKMSVVAADHNGWLLLDGRLKTAFTSTQQASLTALGVGVNIPDMRDRAPMGASASKLNLSTGGVNTIAQNQLPNVAPSVNDPGHRHTVNGGNNFIAYSAGYSGGPNNASGPINYTYSLDIATTGISVSSINGGVAQQTIDPKYTAINFFIYVGA
jgi:hypothetical protein